MFAKKIYTEEDLIARCQRGDRKAQRELYVNYSGKFLALCKRYVKDRARAEDVMIEGFMRIFDSLHQFAFKGSFEGWMRRIMVTQSLLYIRNNKMLMMEVELEGEPMMGYETYSENTELQAEDLIRLVDELPVGYRTVFNLYAIEGYSHREIQELLGISESTSKSQLSRARALLREKLTQEYEKERSHGRQ